MAAENNNNRFPLWQYLNQPVFSSTYKIILNPNRFWRFHQIRHLERCWIKEYRPEEHLH
jgi:hypothetical protein